MSLLQTIFQKIRKKTILTEDQNLMLKNSMMVPSEVIPQTENNNTEETLSQAELEMLDKSPEEILSSITNLKPKLTQLDSSSKMITTLTKEQIAHLKSIKLNVQTHAMFADLLYRNGIQVEANLQQEDNKIKLTKFNLDGSRVGNAPNELIEQISNQRDKRGVFAQSFEEADAYFNDYIGNSKNLVAKRKATAIFEHLFFHGSEFDQSRAIERLSQLDSKFSALVKKTIKTEPENTPSLETKIEEPGKQEIQTPTEVGMHRDIIPTYQLAEETKEAGNILEALAVYQGIFDNTKNSKEGSIGAEYHLLAEKRIKELSAPQPEKSALEDLVQDVPKKTLTKKELNDIYTAAVTLEQNQKFEEAKAQYDAFAEESQDNLEDKEIQFKNRIARFRSQFLISKIEKEAKTREYSRSTLNPDTDPVKKAAVAAPVKPAEPIAIHQLTDLTAAIEKYKSEIGQIEKKSTPEQAQALPTLEAKVIDTAATQEISIEEEPNYVTNIAAFYERALKFKKLGDKKEARRQFIIYDALADGIPEDQITSLTIQKQRMAREEAANLKLKIEQEAATQQYVRPEVAQPTEVPSFAETVIVQPIEELVDFNMSNEELTPVELDFETSPTIPFAQSQESAVTSHEPNAQPYNKPTTIQVDTTISSSLEAMFLDENTIAIIPKPTTNVQAVETAISNEQAVVAEVETLALPKTSQLSDSIPVSEDDSQGLTIEKPRPTLESAITDMERERISKEKIERDSSTVIFWDKQRDRVMNGLSKKLSELKEGMGIVREQTENAIYMPLPLMLSAYESSVDKIKYISKSIRGNAFKATGIAAISLATLAGGTALYLSNNSADLKDKKTPVASSSATPTIADATPQPTIAIPTPTVEATITPLPTVEPTITPTPLPTQTPTYTAKATESKQVESSKDIIKTHTVKPGDTLWDIAKANYDGRGELYKNLTIERNGKEMKADSIEFLLPNDQVQVHPLPKKFTADPKPLGEYIYIDVAKGDTVSRIVKRITGDENTWRKEGNVIIYNGYDVIAKGRDLNNLRETDTVAIKTELKKEGIKLENQKGYKPNYQPNEETSINNIETIVDRLNKKEGKWNSRVAKANGDYQMAQDNIRMLFNQGYSAGDAADMINMTLAEKNDRKTRISKDTVLKIAKEMGLKSPYARA